MTHVLRKESNMRDRLSIPGPGLTVSAATEQRAASVRDAVSILRASFEAEESVHRRWASLLGCRWKYGTLANGSDAASLAAWGLVSIRLVGLLRGSLGRWATLGDAESWFKNGKSGTLSIAEMVGSRIGHRVVNRLEEVSYDCDLQDLLPYVLDAHGPGSRASVKRDPGTATARLAKRASGVFYTPADVAKYIVKGATQLHGGKPSQLRYLDPACGSGVFLKGALNYAKHTTKGNFDCFSFAESCLFGVDNDALAVQSACFVLLAECLDNVRRHDLSPWAMWHRIRCNIVVADALTLEFGGDANQRLQQRISLRDALRDGHVDPVDEVTSGQTVSGLFEKGYRLGDALPELAGGADVIVANPPYASLGPRNDVAGLERRFASAAVGGSSRSLDYYPLFVEMMWRLAKPGQSAAGMVVPLSLAYHSGAQMRACRQAISSSGGLWQFAFFDREPHALFGEDVKTRNTIAFRSESVVSPSRGERANIETGPLRKWTSRNRANLFDAVEFTRLEDSRIEEGIPKLSGDDEAHAMALLKRRNVRLCASCRGIVSRLPVEACEMGGTPRVYVAGTAYNFLNVFRPHRTLPPAKAFWSESRLHCLEFAEEQEAWQAFAILSSRVVYWMWQVLGDGFHVSRGFIENVPFAGCVLGKPKDDVLAELGAKLWDALQDYQIVSVNGGRQTIAYRPHACECVRDQIDTILLESAGIDASFVVRLRSFIRAVVAVDETDVRRRRFLEQFNGLEAQS